MQRVDDIILVRAYHQHHLRSSGMWPQWAMSPSNFIREWIFTALTIRTILQVPFCNSFISGSRSGAEDRAQALQGFPTASIHPILMWVLGSNRMICFLLKGNNYLRPFFFQSALFNIQVVTPQNDETALLFLWRHPQQPHQALQRPLSIASETRRLCTWHVS